MLAQLISALTTVPTNHAARAKHFDSRRAAIQETEAAERKKWLTKAREVSERAAAETVELEAAAVSAHDKLDAELTQVYVSALDKAIADWQSEPARSKLRAIIDLVGATTERARIELGADRIPSVFFAWAMGRAIVGTGASEDTSAPHLDGALTQEATYHHQSVLVAATNAHAAALEKNTPKLSASLAQLEGSLLDVARDSGKPSDYQRARFAALRSRLDGREQARLCDEKEQERTRPAREARIARANAMSRSFTRGDMIEAEKAGFNDTREWIAHRDGLPPADSDIGSADFE